MNVSLVKGREMKFTSNWGNSGQFDIFYDESRRGVSRWQTIALELPESNDFVAVAEWMKPRSLSKIISDDENVEINYKIVLNSNMSSWGE